MIAAVSRCTNLKWSYAFHLMVLVVLLCKEGGCFGGAIRDRHVGLPFFYLFQFRK